MKENLRLRALRAADSQTYFKWINDKELVLFNSAYKPISEESHNNWFSNVTSRTDIKIFSIVLHDNENKETLIGSCSLRNIDLAAHTSELQIRIGEKKFLSKGFGSVAVKKLLDYGFKDLKMNRIYLDVFSSNKRAIRAYEKCGFMYEETKKQRAFVNGCYEDVQMMSILRNGFEMENEKNDNT